jgi:hypothetical protein
MAKKVLDLQYGIGRSFLTGHVTMLDRDSYRAFPVDDFKVIARRDLDWVQYKRLARELSDYSEGNPEHEFNSIGPFEDFVLYGEYPEERSEGLRRVRERDEANRQFDD